MNMLNFPKLVFNSSYITIAILGKNYKLNIKYSNIMSVELVKKSNEIDINLPRKYKNCDNSDIINLAISKLYEDIAQKELEASLELIRHILKFSPDDYKIERIKNAYYKCSKNKTLIINPDIVQFSKEIINTTLLSAFCKINFKANSTQYKTALENGFAKYEAYKNSLNSSRSLKKVS